MKTLAERIEGLQGDERTIVETTRSTRSNSTVMALATGELKDHRNEIAQAWASMGVRGALTTLDLKHRVDGNGALICCQWHNDSSPSCRVSIGQSGTLRIHCFACSETWDVFALVAKVNGLDVKTDFRKVQAIAADAAGLYDVADELEGKAEHRARILPPRPVQAVEVPKPPAYPPHGEVLDLVAACGLCGNDAAVKAWLESRKLDAMQVDVRALAYALPLDASKLPDWAKWWTKSGHRLIVPLFDAAGELRSVRAGTVVQSDLPKRLAPKGFTVSGLVMADELGREVLRGGAWPGWHRGKPQLIVSEGEPDWLAWVTKQPLYEHPLWSCFGIFAGGWTDETAARIPNGSVVAIRTDLDEAGQKFADKVEKTLRHCDCRRKVS
jgi:hypothetical protein